jgi:hypothetical protein
MRSSRKEIAMKLGVRVGIAVLSVALEPRAEDAGAADAGRRSTLARKPSGAPRRIAEGTFVAMIAMGASIATQGCTDSSQPSGQQGHGAD